MIKKKRSVVALFLIVATVLVFFLLVGKFRGGEENTILQGTPEPTSSASAKLTAEIPPNFPSDFPQLSGFQLETGVETEGKSVVVWTTDGDLTSTINTYKTEFEAAGWKIVSEKEQEGTTIFQIEKEDLAGEVGIGRSPERERTVIFVAVWQRVEAPSE